MCHNELKSLAPRRAAKIAAAAASVNFGWRGGAPNFFRRRRRGRVPAGFGGRIRRLRGLINTASTHEQSATGICYLQNSRTTSPLLLICAALVLPPRCDTSEGLASILQKQKQKQNIKLCIVVKYNQSKDEKADKQH